jgi:hypothetical protein
MRNAHDILAGKSEGKRPFEISKRRLEDQIKGNHKQQSVTLLAGFIWLRIWTWK